MVLSYLVDIDFLGLQNMLSALPDGLVFFLTLFQFHVGMPLIFGAAVAKFAIRRIPVIG